MRHIKVNVCRSANANEADARENAISSGLNEMDRTERGFKALQREKLCRLQLYPLMPSAYITATARIIWCGYGACHAPTAVIQTFAKM